MKAGIDVDDDKDRYAEILETMLKADRSIFRWSKEISEKQLQVASRGGVEFWYFFRNTWYSMPTIVCLTSTGFHFAGVRRPCTYEELQRMGGQFMQIVLPLPGGD